MSSSVTTSSNVSSTDSALIQQLRECVNSYLVNGQHKSAVFWSDKLLSISDSIADFLLYLQCLMQCGEYERTLACIQSDKCELKHLVFQWLAVRCLFHTKRFAEAVALAETPLEQPGQKKIVWKCPADLKFLDSKSIELRLPAAFKVLLARLYEQVDNKQQAVEMYKAALTEDVFCAEALDALTDQCLITPKDEQELLLALPLEGTSHDEMTIDMLRYLYECKLNKFSAADLDLLPPKRHAALQGLADNSSILVAKAERRYYAGDFKGALECTNKVLSKEKLHTDCLAVHICLLVESQQSKQLFVLAHKLVDLYPDAPISWYCVGAYYYSLDLCEGAKRIFHKSTCIDPNFGQGWLAYGHALAAQGEHDQAMNCYLRAARVMQGCHLPQLYIGLEYCLTNNIKLGERFFEDAYRVAPSDPHVLHEMGVMAFRSGDFKTAERHFSAALKHLESIFGRFGLPLLWEPLLNNLGHLKRKLGEYEVALSFHERALVLVPKSASTLGSIGFVHLLMGNADLAIEYFHQSLSLKRDAKNISTLLNRAVDWLQLFCWTILQRIGLLCLLL